MMLVLVEGSEKAQVSVFNTEYPWAQSAKRNQLRQGHAADCCSAVQPRQPCRGPTAYVKLEMRTFGANKWNSGQFRGHKGCNG